MTITIVVTALFPSAGVGTAGGVHVALGLQGTVRLRLVVRLGRVVALRPAGTDQIPQHAEQFPPGAQVECPGGFIGEENGRAGHQGAGDGDALLLTAGELTGPVAGLLLEPHLTERVQDRSPVGLDPGEAQRQRHILFGGQRGQQVERLEDEARRLPAHLGELRLAEPDDVLAVDEHPAG